MIILKIYNNSEKSINTEENDIKLTKLPQKQYKGRICNKIYSNVKSRWPHERVCNTDLDKPESAHELRRNIFITKTIEQPIQQPAHQPQEQCNNIAILLFQLNVISK